MAQFERRSFPEINRVVYEITDAYGHTAELSPKELLQLLVFLQDFEQQIIQDAQDTRLPEEYSVEEIAHAREIMERGGTNITDLVLRRLQEDDLTSPDDIDKGEAYRRRAAGERLDWDDRP